MLDNRKVVDLSKVKKTLDYEGRTLVTPQTANLCARFSYIGSAERDEHFFRKLLSEVLPPYIAVDQVSFPGKTADRVEMEQPLAAYTSSVSCILLQLQEYRANRYAISFEDAKWSEAVAASQQDGIAKHDWEAKHLLNRALFSATSTPSRRWLLPTQVLLILGSPERSMPFHIGADLPTLNLRADNVFQNNNLQYKVPVVYAIRTRVPDVHKLASVFAPFYVMECCYGAYDWATSLNLARMAAAEITKECDADVRRDFVHAVIPVLVQYYHNYVAGEYNEAGFSGELYPFCDKLPYLLPMAPPHVCGTWIKDYDELREAGQCKWEEKVLRAAQAEKSVAWINSAGFIGTAETEA